MKRILLLTIMCFSALTFFAYAEDVIRADTDTLVEVPVYNGTGDRPNVNVVIEEPFSLTMEDSAIPFAELDWDLTADEVISVTGGQLADNQTDVEQEIKLPGISDPRTVVYHIGENGLDSVSVILDSNIKKAVDLESDSQAFALIQIAKAYYNTQDADEMMSYTWGPTYFYKSTVSDLVLGYIPYGKKYNFGMIFTKAASFDQSIFRDDSLYDMSTEYDGTLLYAADASRLERVNLKLDQNTNFDVVFSDGVYMFGASKSVLNAIPYYRLIIVYIGNADPKDVKTLIFTVDEKLYQFTIPDNMIVYQANNGSYLYQCSIVIGDQSSEFMDAFVNASGDIPFEMRRDKYFRVLFDINKEWIHAIEEDWKNFKQAGGMSPFYSLAADETPLTVY